MNLCLATATAEITVGDTTKPTLSANATMATCTGETANNDGKLIVSNVVNGIKYQFSAGNVFDANTATPAVTTAIPIGGILSTNLINPSGNTQKYTIRIYNNNDCFKDITVDLQKRVCACKTEICIPILINKSKSK